MGYYHKYRPQTVAELDLVGVRTAFLQMMAAGKIGHAYLFAGPKGTGKTSSARILAKMVNCERNRDGRNKERGISNDLIQLQEPCGECGSCRAIVKSSSLAVMEMDAASNRGIEDIRGLRERVALAPADAPYAVYVIDEVHMLTTEAFNALLKTLEEPPKHAIFILCTTELHKVPETIGSRCQVVAFTKATAAELVASVSKAVKGEKLTISTEALTALGVRVDGSFRDGMKLLEQLALGGQPITQAMVDEVTGYGELYDGTLLVQALLAGEINNFFTILDEKIARAVDPALLVKRMIEAQRLKLLSLIKAGKRQSPEAMASINLINSLLEVATQQKNTPLSVLPLELMAAKWETKEVKAPVLTPQEVVPAVQKPAPSTVEIKIEDVLAKWTEVLKRVKPHNHSIEALLRAARPLKTEEGKVFIEVFYNFHKEQLEQERHIAVIERVMGEIWGEGVGLKFVLGNKAQKALSGTGEAIANVTGQVADEKIAEVAEEIFG